MKTMHGKPISDDQINQWADEAEHGYDPETLLQRGRPGRGAVPATVVKVRLTDTELNNLTKAARARNLNRSEAIRLALNQWADV